MAEDGIGKTVTDFKNELMSLENRAKDVQSRFEVLCREAEVLKIESLQRHLEKQRKDMARSRGLALVLKDPTMVRGALLMAAGSFIGGGLISKDKSVALISGISGLEGFLQGLGTARWFVSIGGKVVVAPQDGVSSDVKWFTWESLMSAIEELKERASQGVQLGNWENVTDSIEGIVSPSPQMLIIRLNHPEARNP